MKRWLVVSAAVAGSLVIASAAGGFLFRGKLRASAGAQTAASPSTAQSQSPRAGAHAAIGVIAVDRSANANASVAPATNTPTVIAEEARKEEPLDESLFRPAEPKIRERIAAELRRVVPEAVPLLAEDISQLATKDELFAVLLRVLDAAQSAPPSEQPPLLLAADLLADKVDFGMNVQPAPETKKKLDELARYGLKFSWSELDAAWGYSHDLMWRVWRDFPASPWAEDAFMLLLERAWDASLTCNGGTDSFRAVIREGENFLATHPQSRYRLETTYLLAQGYETWWSLSRAKDCRTVDASGCDEYVDAASYLEGAQEARRKAMIDYEEVLQINPAGDIAGDARRRLDDLKQNLDTVQRRFFCIYD